MLFHARTVICLSPLTRGIKGTMLVIGVARLVLGVRSLYLLFFPLYFYFLFPFFFFFDGEVESALTAECAMKLIENSDGE